MAAELVDDAEFYNLIDLAYIEQEEKDENSL